MEEWIVKVTELTEMAKITCLVRVKTISTFIKDWKHFMKVGKKRNGDFWI